MKYLIPVLSLAVIAACNIKKETKKARTITMAPTSLSAEEISKINPQLLDSTYWQDKDGNMNLSISVAKNLDSTYVEDPVTGVITLVVSRPNQTKQIQPNLSSPKSGDTIYIEDPRTGKIKMVITE